MDRRSNKPTPKRGSAFEKLQSEREAKGVEEDLQRDEEERQERKQIRQEEREERKREREKAPGACLPNERARLLYAPALSLDDMGGGRR